MHIVNQVVVVADAVITKCIERCTGTTGIMMKLLLLADDDNGDNNATINMTVFC